MLYRLPESGDRDTLAAYVQEHHDCGESSISASLGLSSSEYNEWVDTIHRSATEGQPPWGKSTLFLCFDGNRYLIGFYSKTAIKNGMLSAYSDACRSASQDVQSGVLQSAGRTHFSVVKKNGSIRSVVKRWSKPIFRTFKSPETLVK